MKGSSRVDVEASLKQGAISGFKVLWELAKVTVPTVVVVTLMEKSGVLAHVSSWLGPMMAVFGLPGETALVLVMANTVSLYAGLAAMVALALTAKQLLILSAMVMICHGAITETALISRTGARGSWMLGARFLAMILVALILNGVVPT